MPESNADPDALVTLTTSETEFQAGMVVAVLEEAGIKAFSFGAVAAMEPLGKRLTPVVVQVRRGDLERARAAMSQNISDSVDLDWDEVDVGERADDLPLTPTTHMPLIPRLGFIAAIVIIAVVAALAIVRLIFNWP